MLVSFTILIVANIKERKERAWTPVYVFFQVLLIFIMIWKFAGISDIIDLTTFDLVVKTTEDADCRNGNKYYVPVLSDQYKKLGRAA